MKAKYIQIVLAVVLVQFFLLSNNSSAQWEYEVVAEGGLIATEWAIADIDNDGDPDLTYAEQMEINWYENQLGNWSKKSIDGFSDLSTARVSGQFAFDLDQDGDQDLIHLQYSTPSAIYWYENLLDGQIFAKYTINASIGFLTNLFGNIDDIDGDGDLDIVAGDRNGEIFWFENSGNNISWPQHHVASFTPMATWVSMMDIDGDNDPDVIAAVHDTIVCYENQLPATTWQKKVIAPLPPGSYFFKAADINNDGALDLVTHSHAENRLVWYDNPTWNLHTVADKIPGPFLRATGDIDNDGDVDVLFSQTDGIGWIENRQDGTEWQVTIIDTVSGMLFYPLGIGDQNGLGDFNQDGKLDVAATTIMLNVNLFGPGDLRWYANPGVTQVKLETGNSLPNEITLSQNYPNPFNPSTTISYSIPQPGFVTLNIYDMVGREVQAQVNEIKQAGRYSFEFDASNFSTGVYFYKLHVNNNFSEIKKMLYIK